ncbi:hypothetical protein LF65_01644 [Clostridium beijerinckii]|uniref:Autolysin n=1 Tax=Clostridium beijerinckii TaxID=1520 RepID=A0A0B5Q7X0_CLOBE|nr:N-acetylmuramoyl-L-alanine amidase family protein [Clostridium beijerinckii]AJG98249.1 hypothetical protein LF65_01644 [Clostridium beijerinckii]
MIKRVKSISSLLVAATSVISMVPAMASDTTKLQRLEIKEGTIYQAKSLAWGHFCVEGEINGTEDAFYYIDDKGNYIKLEDASLGDTIDGLYENDKYLLLLDGDDEEWFDTATGKKVDDRDDPAEIDRTLSTTIKRVIRKDDNGLFEKSSYTDNTIQKGAGALPAKSGGTNEFNYPLKESNLIGIREGKLYAIGSDGKYIYGDYDLGSIYVSTTHGGVYVKNTEDTYEIKDKGETYEVKAVLESPLFSITGAENPSIDIYRNLSIWLRKKGDTSGDYDGYENVTDQVELGSKAHHYNMWTDHPIYADDSDDGSLDGTNSSGAGRYLENQKISAGVKPYGKYIRVFQRISQEPSATETYKGIKLPKTVDTYFLADEDGNLYNNSNMRFLIRNNWAISIMDYLTSNPTSITMQKMEYKSDNGYKHVEPGELRTIDNFDVFTPGWGRPRFVKDGDVYEFNPKEDEYTKIFKISSKMNKIDTSVAGQIIAWNEDEGIYSFSGLSLNDYIASKMKKPTATAAAGASATSTTAAGASVQVSTGWVSDQNKSWSYILKDGTKAKGWLNDSGTWYYLKDDGAMAKGWINDKGIWYYLSESGAMKTGWINDNGTWYYCNESGAMLANTTVDGYVLGANGAWVK